MKLFNLENLKGILRYIKDYGIIKVFKASFNKIKYGKAVLDEYAEWRDNNEPKDKQLKKQQKYVSCQNLKFALVCEEKNNELEESISNQTYKNYNVEYLENKTIAEIAESTESDYLVFIGKDIVLYPFTLFELVKSIEGRDSILIYSDNDKFIERKRNNPNFKPGFSRDTILSKNYIGNFIAVKANFLKIHNEIPDNINKSYIYDLILQISEKTRKIEHIQKILFGETIENVKIDTEDEKKIIEKHLERMGLEYDSIQDGKYKGQYKINYKIKGNPLVSLVVPNKDLVEDLKKLIESVKKSTYQNYEIVIVENNSEKKETFEYYEQIQKEDSRIRVETIKIDYFNYSAIVNFGVEKAKGEYIVLLNNDIEILTHNWIEEMLMYTQRPDVGICGIKLYFPDRSIQHAGVTIGTRGLAGHRYREVAEKDFSANDYINMVQNLSAVTAACFMVRKQLFIDMLGFDEKLAVAFNDVDFCLNVRAAKYLIVYNPFVEAYHYESKSRGEDEETPEKQKRFEKEYRMFVKRWRKIISKGDPYYNVNYRLDKDVPAINHRKIM